MSELFWKCPHCEANIVIKEGDDYALTIGSHLLSCPRKPGPAIRTYKNLAEVVPKEVLKGNLITMDELVDKTILVKEFVFRESTFKEDTDYLSITIDVDGEEKVVNTGAERVVQVFKALAPGLLPVYATFEKITLPNGRRVYRVKE